MDENINKIGIATVYTGYNYGSALQAFATTRIISSLGMTAALLKLHGSLIAGRDIRAKKLFTVVVRSLCHSGGIKSLKNYGKSMSKNLQKESIRLFDTFTEQNLRPIEMSYTELKKRAYTDEYSVEELYKLRGSKYVQSDTTSAFIKVKTDLLEGRPVLFTGTPCQVAGLKSFLGKPYDHLICVDLICHGVPSSQYFLDYLHHLEHKTGSKIQGFNFRDKRTKGWGLSGTYEGTREGTCEKYTHKLFYFQSYYYSYFLHGETYRESCYSCKYASLNRVGDFTMGDLWGAEGMRLPFSVEGGCSLVIANSIKAQELLNALEIQYAEVPLEVAVRYNQQLQTPSECPRHREDRIKEYKVNSTEEIERNFFQAYRKANCIAKLKYLTPMWLKKILLRFR